MNAVDKIKGLIDIADELCLAGREILHAHTIDELDEAYNGIGPAWFHPKLREAIDSLHADFEVCALIHDAQWSLANDGTDSTFDLSNDMLEANGLTIANIKYGWYNPVRYVRRHQAHLFADLCRKFGKSAYRTAYADSKKGGEA